MKLCGTCKVEKPFSEFNKNRQTKDGHCCRCKVCRSAYDREYCRKNPEKKAEWTKRWDQKNRERVNEIHRKWHSRNRAHSTLLTKRYRERNPRKWKARAAVGHAIKKGTLVRPDKCTVCEMKHDAIHGHHENYDKQLEVVWLCLPCHNARHKVMTAEGVEA